MAPARRSGLALPFLAVVLAAVVSAQGDGVPVLENEGGPPFLDAVVYSYSTQPGDSVPEGSVNRAGVINGGRFTYTRYTGEGPLTYMGNYVSWECVDPDNEPGTYRAIVAVQALQPDPDSNVVLVVQQVICEYGVVSPANNIHRWAWGDDTTCPNVTTRVNYRDWAPPGLNYTCGVPDLSQAEAELDTGEEPVLEQTTDSSYPDAYVDVEGDGLVNLADNDDDGDGIPDSQDPDANGDGYDDETGAQVLGAPGSDEGGTRR